MERKERMGQTIVWQRVMFTQEGRWHCVPSAFFLFIHAFIHLPVYPHTEFIYPCIYRYMHLSFFHPSIHSSAHSSVYLCIPPPHPYIHPKIHLSFLFIHPFHPPFHPPTNLPIHPFMHSTCIHLPIDPSFSTSWTSLVAETVKASAYNAGDPASIPGLGRSFGEGNGNPLQYSCLENPVDGGAR